MLEKQVEAFVGREVKKLGGLWLKFTSPGRTGVPDRILILQGRVAFVEMKTDTGVLSPIQKATVKMLVETGRVPVHVVYGKSGAERFLREIKSPAGVVWTEGIWEWR